MRSFVLVSSAAAPVILVGGWTVAQSRQPLGYNPVRDAISDLAAIGAADRAIMSAAFVGVGVAYLVTAIGLSEISRIGRSLIAVAGVATVLVAVFPLPTKAGQSVPHMVVATTAFLALAIWPFFGSTGGRAATAALRPPLSVAAGVVLLGLAAWFILVPHGSALVGLAERIAAGAQAIWPLIVALAVRRSPVVDRARNRTDLLAPDNERR